MSDDPDLLTLIDRAIGDCKRALLLYDADSKAKREQGIRPTSEQSVARHNLGAVQAQLNRIRGKARTGTLVDNDTLSAMGSHDATGADHLADAMEAAEQRDRLSETLRRLLGLYLPHGHQYRPIKPEDVRLIEAANAADYRDEDHRSVRCWDCRASGDRPIGPNSDRTWGSEWHEQFEAYQAAAALLAEIDTPTTTGSSTSSWPDVCPTCGARWAIKSKTMGAAFGQPHSGRCVNGHGWNE